MTQLIQDLRLAARSLARRPGLTVTILFTLALGIGGTTAIFSVVEGVLLRPLPFDDPERLVRIWTQFPEHQAFQFPVSEAEYVDYRDSSELYEDVAAYAEQTVTLTGTGEPVRLGAAFASSSLWTLLGVEPHLGRFFGPDDDRPGAGSVALLSHGLWQRRFGGSEKIVGSDVTLNGGPVTVIGVLPPGFRFPERTTELWLPLRLDESAITSRSGHYLGLVGRLSAGASLAEVRAEMEVIVGRWSGLYEHAHPMTASALRDHVLGDAEGPLLLLLAATGFVLLIACVNVAGLLLARGEGRWREIGVRTALGAGRGRLVRQLLTESVLLAGASGLLGLAVAWLGLAALKTFEPGDLPRLDQVGLDGLVLLVNLAVSLATGLFFGILPALRVSRTDLSSALRDSGHQTTSGSVRQRLRGLMVVAEVAVAVVLVAAAGLLLRSFSRLQQVDPGVDPEGVLTARISLPASAYPGVADVVAFHTELMPRLEALPGVRSASMVNHLPFSGNARLESFFVEGRPRGADDEGIGADLQMVAPGYFRTLGVPLRRGRGFSGADRSETPRVVILTESVANAVFGDEDPVGRRIEILAARPRQPSFEIVGVVGDVTHGGLADGVRPQIYLPLAQGATEIGGIPRAVTVTLKTTVESAALAGPLRRQVWEADPDLAISDLRTLRTVLSDSLAPPRFTTLLMSGFSALALLLAAVGFYGLLAHVVSLRRREFGIRLALGARRRQLIGLVVRRGLVLAAAGLALGLTGALAAGRLLERFLFEVRATDTLSFAATPVVLALAALLACYIPARRAASVDPAHALRQD